MAISGGMTTAYRYRLVGGVLNIERTTYPTQQCQHPQDAAAALRNGAASVTVRGSDAAAFREAWDALSRETGNG